MSYTMSPMTSDPDVFEMLESCFPDEQTRADRIQALASTPGIGQGEIQDLLEDFEARRRVSGRNLLLT